MANETEYSNYITVAAFLDTAIAPHFRAAAIMPNLVHTVNFVGKSDSVKLRKAGSVSATAATESTDHAVSEYTETSPATLTAGEIKVYLELSDKAIKFAQADMNDLAREAGVACAQKFDIDALALLDSLNGGTQVGTSGGDLTIANLITAMYTLEAQNIPGPYVFTFHPAQMLDIRNALNTAGAVAWTNARDLAIFSGQPPSANGFKGEILGASVFQTTNTESVNGNADWAGGCFSPQLALAAGFAGDVTTKIGYNVKKGVTEIGVSLWYDVKEYQDLAGVSIETGK